MVALSSSHQIEIYVRLAAASQGHEHEKAS